MLAFVLGACSESTGDGGNGTGDGATSGTGDTTGGSDACDPAADTPTECNTYAQDCPAGEKCVPYGAETWDADGCFPIAGAGAPGDPCTAACGPTGGLDDCGAASMCWDVDVDGEGRCVALCGGVGGDPRCDVPDTDCMLLADGKMPLCLDRCDPVAGGCDGVCVPNWNSQSFLCMPESGEPKAYGDACDRANDCAAGMFCIIPIAVPGCDAAVGCCSELCDLDDPAASEGCAGAADGQQCLPYYDGGGGAPPEYEHVGVCAVPPP